MFQEMRRKRQALQQNECFAVLDRGTSGVLALSGEDGCPYAVPLSYVRDGERLYFHCARAGHKLDLIRQNSKASFCVIDMDRIIPEEYTTYFRSVIVSGTVHILEDDAEKRSAIEKLAVRYAPEDSAEHRARMIDREWEPLCMLEMTIEHMTGKEAIELMKARSRQAEG